MSNVSHTLITMDVISKDPDCKAPENRITDGEDNDSEELLDSVDVKEQDNTCKEIIPNADERDDDEDCEGIGGRDVTFQYSECKDEDDGVKDEETDCKRAESSHLKAEDESRVQIAPSAVNEEANLPLRVEGWVNVWDVSGVEEREMMDGGQLPAVPSWEPSFCVLLQDMGKFTFYGSEQIASERTCPIPRRRLRLDGGKEEFDRRWGYDHEPTTSMTGTTITTATSTTLMMTGLESITETPRPEDIPSDPHSTTASDTDSTASAESFFKTRTFQDRNENLPDSSAAKRGGEERRGSVPLVAGGPSDDEGGGSTTMEASGSATSRLVHFFSKKGFRSNLKRTKSATKLDRKRSGSNVSEREASSVMGTLRRSMSLGRLARKRNKTPSQADEPDVSLISARIRAARSHESLLSNPSAMQAVDITGRDAEVKAVHQSMLARDHCFHITTSQGSKYISCSTADERDQWLSSLRRTKRPNQDHVRRSDNCLKLWIVEAKNLPPKKRYFCEILLDHKPFACTSSKLMAEMLFWGEHFEFKDLPAVETITVNLFREAEKKKKKDRSVLVCYVILQIADISNKQFVEKWFHTVCGTMSKSSKDSKGDVPLIRMKVRHQTVKILPKEFYHNFSKYLTTDYKEMCELLEHQLSLREKEEFATNLVHAMHKLGKAKAFLCDIVMSEISGLENENLTFRGNSIATKAMEAYMKLVGERYLHDTLGDFVRGLVESEDDYEVDPAKVNNATLHSHQASLESFATKVWDRIISSNRYFPNELREVFAIFREHCRAQGKEDFSDNLISASIFLRFLCPAILSPSLFNITQEYPHERAARNLTLVAKTIQTLANFTTFGGKEDFMTFMNGFIEKEAVRMKNFLRKISSEESGNQFLQYEGFIDLERELSVLHTMLLDYIHRSPEATQKKFSGLLAILTAISDALNDPSVGQQPPSSRRSQIMYDNMPAGTTASTTVAYASSVHSSSRTVQSTVHNTVRSATLPAAGSTQFPDASATEALREMLRQCGEPDEDLYSFAARAMRDNHRRETGSELRSLEKSGIPDPSREKSSMPSDIRTSDRSKELSEEFSALYSSSSVTLSKYNTSSAVRGEVGDVSANSQSCVNKESVNETWSQMVSAADDSVYGDYIDLIPFMDEEGQTSSSELEGPTVNSSQVSISQLSTVASSGYQSFGYSQSSSPVENAQQTEMSREVPKSPIIHYPPHPLSFNNPLYRHQQLSQHHRRHHQPQRNIHTCKLVHVHKDTSSSDAVKGAEGNTDKESQPTPVKSEHTKSLQATVDPLRKLSQLSSSSGSNESLNGRHGAQQDKTGTSNRWVAGRRERGAQFSVGSRGSSPAQAHSSPQTERTNSQSGPPPEVPPRPHRLSNKLREEDSSPPPAVPPRPDRTNSYCDTASMEQRHLGMRPYHLSHSMDFGCLQRQHAEHLRRTATDSVIVKTSTPVHMHSGNSGSPRFSRENSFSSVHSSQSQMSLSSRRLSPQSAVHMGISSVQRKLQEQERTKQEYENEVHILRQQLVEAQVRLQSAEMRLMEHEVETHQLMEEWQSRLAESEQRIRQQQAEKDGQMKSIIERLVTIEEELRKEQAEMQKVVHEKQQVIEIQEQRLRTLDSANAKLLKALAELQEHATTNSNNAADDSNNNNSNSLDGGRSGSSNTPHNGITGPIRTKLTTADFASFKSSTC